MKQYNSFWFYESKAAKERARWICSSCGSVYPVGSKGVLVTHHKDFRKKNDFHSNLEVLCKWCHRKVHQRYNRSTWSYGGFS